MIKISNLIKTDFEKFENDVMKKILQEDNSLKSVLCKQYENAIIVNREFTGYGFFTKFSIPNKSLCLTEPQNIELGNTQAIIKGIKNGIGFVLFIRNGFISSLEGYTYDEKWPDDITNYQLF